MVQMIMIGTDDPNITYLLQRYAQESGFQTAHVGSSTDLLDLARQLDPALIILDVELARTTDREVLRRLRADPTTRRIPVIIYSCLEEPMEDWTEGADGYLSQSIMYDDFVAMLQRASSIASPLE